MEWPCHSIYEGRYWPSSIACELRQTNRWYPQIPDPLAFVCASMISLSMYTPLSWCNHHSGSGKSGLLRPKCKLYALSLIESDITWTVSSIDCVITFNTCQSYIYLEQNLFKTKFVSWKRLFPHYFCPFQVLDSIYYKCIKVHVSKVLKSHFGIVGVTHQRSLSSLDEIIHTVDLKKLTWR